MLTAAVYGSDVELTNDWMHECITYVLITSLEAMQFALNLLIFDASNSFIILLNVDLKLSTFWQIFVWFVLSYDFNIFTIFFRKCKFLSLIPFIECITSFQYLFIANFITLANMKKVIFNFVSSNSKFCNIPKIPCGQTW